MKKKIFLLIIALLSFFINVNADNLQIDGNTYELTTDIIGTNFHYYFENNILELTNYNGGNISKDGNLSIIIKGDNVINGNSTLIDAEIVTIDGNGTLKFKEPVTAIHADDITINNITMKGDNIKELFLFENSLNIKNANIEVNSNWVLIKGGKYVNISNSIIKSSNVWGFNYSPASETLITNSNIEMTCSIECLNLAAKIHFKNTNATFYGKYNATNMITLLLDENSDYLVSNDGINYTKEVDYMNYKYLKIFSNVKDENKEENNNDNASNETKKDANLSQNNNLESVYTKNEYESNVNIENPKTGDNIIFWIGLLTISVIGIIVLVFYIKGDNHGKNETISIK